MLIFMLGCVLWPALSGAQRRATLAPPPGTWQIDFELHGNPQQINLTLPGEAAGRPYWYLLYTVTNHTGQDVNFYPRFEIFTDTFKLYQANINVRQPVFEAIRRRYATTIPLLEPQSQVMGRLLVGEDNARDSVVVFDDFDPNSNAIKLFVSGLSSEVARIKSPYMIDSETNQPKETLLRRSLMLEYQVPGDPLNPEMRVMLFQRRSWVLR